MPRNHHIYEELRDPVDLIIHTKSPEKWLLIDRETGQVYVGNSSGHWDKLIAKQKESSSGTHPEV